MPTQTEIATSRLLLRPFQKGDLPAFFTIMQNPDTNLFLPWFPLQTIQQAETCLLRDFLPTKENPYRYAICLANQKVPIGYIRLAGSAPFDLGYGLLPAYWGQNIATEAGKALLPHLQKEEIPYITATHDVKNPASGKVMEKLGMTYEYTYEEQWMPKDKMVTFRMYQKNLSKPNAPLYKGYWNRYPNHFIEKF